MHINVIPIREDLDVLDHRRARLCEILALGLVSPEMQGQLRATLMEVERRIDELSAARDHGQMRRAA